MNISMRELFSSCYNYVNNQLYNLSPLQKKVAVAAITYFSCATAGYFIYRLYCFRAHSIHLREDDVEYFSMSPVKRKSKKEFNQFREENSFSEDSSFEFENQVSKDLSLSEYEQKTTHLEESSLLEIEESSLKDPSFNFKKPLLSLEPGLKKEFNDAEVKDNHQKIHEFVLENLKKMDFLKASFEDQEDPFADMDTQFFSQETSSIKKYPIISPFSSVSEQSFSIPPPNPQDERQKDIEKRLEKNCAYAIAQQNKEIPKVFFVDAIVSDSFNDVPINRIALEDSHERSVGISSCKNRRATMEDKSDAMTISFSINGKTHKVDVCGVYDGHGGDQAAAFVKDNLANYLKEALEKYNSEILTDVGIWDALKSSFEKLDADFHGPDGTTAVVALILNEKIWVANVGDSRAILVKNDGRAVQATEDQKPEIPRYKKKIEQYGGRIQFLASWRVMGNLAVARAIGDKNVVGRDGECCVMPTPKITCYPLKDYIGGHLVLASDGLFNVATTDDVGLAIKHLAAAGFPAEEMAQNLVHAAMKYRSEDNISVLVVNLSH